MPLSAEELEEYAKVCVELARQSDAPDVQMAAELVRLNVDVIVARARWGRSPPNEPPQRSPLSCRQQAIRWEAGLLPDWVGQVATSLA
jgi:hypothetical protein